MRLTSGFAVVLLLATVARADPAADAKAHSDAFARAINAGDKKAVVALYADDARVIWPGAGDEANGRAAIEKLVDETLKAFPEAKLTLKSQQAIPLGNGYIATVGHWEQSWKNAEGKTETAQVRTSEVIHKQGKRTLYVIDHASIGLAPPPPASPGNPK